MFIIAPSSIEAIDQEGLPSARMTAFIILDSINAGKNAKIILKYSIAIPILFSDAPNKVKSCVFNVKKINMSTILVKSVTIIPVPIALCADCVFFSLDICSDMLRSLHRNTKQRPGQ